MWNRISEIWCKKLHHGAMWPIHGRYVCPDCLREYPVIWESSGHRDALAEGPYPGSEMPIASASSVPMVN
jgi:hypothetical protein